MTTFGKSVRPLQPSQKLNIQQLNHQVKKPSVLTRNDGNSGCKLVRVVKVAGPKPLSDSRIPKPPNLTKSMTKKSIVISSQPKKPNETSQSKRPNLTNHKAVPVKSCKPGGINFKADPNSMRTIISSGKQRNESKSVTNFRSNYEQRRMTLNSSNSNSRPSNNSLAPVSSMRRLTLNSERSSTVKHVANFVRDSKASESTFLTPKRKVLEVSNNNSTNSSTSFGNSIRRLSLAANNQGNVRRLSLFPYNNNNNNTTTNSNNKKSLQSERSVAKSNPICTAPQEIRRKSLFQQRNPAASNEFDNDRRKSLFSTYTTASQSCSQSHSENSGTRRQSLFPASTATRRQSLFPRSQSLISTDPPVTAPKTRASSAKPQFKSDREMQQVDDLLERSKRLLKSISCTTPKKTAQRNPIIQQDHEREMAEILALERQLEMEISMLEKN